MKLDKESEWWLIKKVMFAYIPLAAMILIVEGFGLLSQPLNLTVSDSLFTCGLLLWGMLVICSMIDAVKMTREHMGLKPHWTDSAIDELEARVEKLERERP